MHLDRKYWLIVDNAGLIERDALCWSDGILGEAPYPTWLPGLERSEPRGSETKVGRWSPIMDLDDCLMEM